jgi:hypothetical protein
MTQWFVGLQADATRLVESGGGEPLAAYTEQEEASAAAVAARLEAHARELAEVDRTQKCAVLESIPSSLLTALSRVQDCFCLSDPNLPDCPIVYASPAFLKLTGYPCRWAGCRGQLLCCFFVQQVEPPVVFAPIHNGLKASTHCPPCA